MKCEKFRRLEPALVERIEQAMQEPAAMQEGELFLAMETMGGWAREANRVGAELVEAWHGRKWSVQRQVNSTQRRGPRKGSSLWEAGARRDTA